MARIKIKRSTRDILARYGYVGYTWDYVINNALDHLDSCDRYWEIENEKW